METIIDLEFRPKTYFRPQSLELHLLSKIKGAVLKKKIQALFAEGRHDEVAALLGADGISTGDQKALEGWHPMFMGGNYLPDTEDGEVEIARISIKSTTFDVTSVFARPDQGVIRYRVVDEYGGDTLAGDDQMESRQPLSLRELADFFLNAWQLLSVLEMNYEDDLDGRLKFFSADSVYYSEFDRLCRQRVIAHFHDEKIGASDSSEE